MSRRTWAAPYALAAAALLLLAVGVVLLGRSPSAPHSGEFGMQRTSLRTVPGSSLAGRLQLPTGVDAQDVRWQATHDGETIASGSGATWRLTAPASGSVRFSARVAGSDRRTSLVIAVVDPGTVVATDVVVTGRVLVDGGRAVQGEALQAGAEVDATAGSIAYTATARTDTGLDGRITLEGAELTLDAEAAANGRVRNVISLERDEDGDQLLVADVEHLDGTRYVEVETPDAVAMVKGTRFWVRVDDAGTDVAVDHGWVVVEERADEDADAVDVRDDSSTLVPRVDAKDDEAATADRPLVVRKVEDFDAVVDEHRTRVREDLEAEQEPLEVAPAPQQPNQPQQDQQPQQPQQPDPGTTPPTDGGGGNAKPPKQPKPPTDGGTAPTPVKPPADGTTGGGQAPKPPKPCQSNCPAPQPGGTITQPPPNTSTQPAPLPCGPPKCPDGPINPQPLPVASPTTTTTSTGTGTTTTTNTNTTYPNGGTTTTSGTLSGTTGSGT